VAFQGGAYLEIGLGFDGWEEKGRESAWGVKRTATL